MHPVMFHFSIHEPNFLRFISMRNHCKEIFQQMLYDTVKSRVNAQKKFEENVSVLYEMAYHTGPTPNIFYEKCLMQCLRLEEARLLHHSQELEMFNKCFPPKFRLQSIPNCQVPCTICDLPCTIVEPKVKSKKDILVELLRLDELYGKEFIQRANNLSWDDDIDLSFLQSDVAAAGNVLTTDLVDVNLLRPTINLIYPSTSPASNALWNLKNGRE